MRASYGARQRPAEPSPWPAPRRPWALGVVCALVAAAAHTAAAGGQEGGGRGAAAVTSISGGNGTWINWEGTVACHPQTLAAPTTVEEVARLVAGHARVRTAGLGHSFNDFVCSRDLMLATTGLNQVLGLDARALTVTTQTGVRTRDLMTWLGDRGYALPTYAYYIDQTIAGAIATNSHGSSMRHGTMSSLVRAAKVVLANGTVVTIDGGRPEHLAAIRSNVGLLGVVVELTLDVVKNAMAYRNSTLLDQSAVLADMDRALADPTAVDGLQFCYFPVLRTVMRSEVRPSSWATRLVTALRGGAGARTNDGTFDLPEANSRAYWTAVHPFPLSDTAYLAFVRYFTQNPSIEVNQRASILSAYLFMAYPGFYPVGKAMPTQPEVYTEILLQTLKTYDQYEWAVPFSHMKDCVQGLFDLAEHNPAFRQSNRSPLLFRFVAAEPGVLLSLTHDGPRFFVNIDNYHAYKEHPEAFDEIKQHLASPRCQGRVHLGKTSLRSAPGLDWKAEDVAEAKAQFGNNWARFEKVMTELDPAGKFADPHNLFRPPPPPKSSSLR